MEGSRGSVPLEALQGHTGTPRRGSKSALARPLRENFARRGPAKGNDPTAPTPVSPPPGQAQSRPPLTHPKFRRRSHRCHAVTVCTAVASVTASTAAADAASYLLPSVRRLCGREVWHQDCSVFKFGRCLVRESPTCGHGLENHPKLWVAKCPVILDGFEAG